MPRKKETPAQPVKGLRYLDQAMWPIHVAVTADQVAFDREMRRLGIDTFPICASNGATTHVFERKGHSLLMIVGLTPEYREYSWTQVAAMLAHEAVHVVQNVNDVLSPQAALGDETEAYLVQWVTQESLCFFYETGGTRRVKPRGIRETGK